jgi:hypothetical protein
MAVQRIYKDIPLSGATSDPRGNDWYDLAAGKGVLVLAKLREELGSRVFDEAMDSFGKAHAGKEVTTAEFRSHMEKMSGKSLEPFFQKYVQSSDPNGPGTATWKLGTKKERPVWSIFGWEKGIEDTLIIYGTQAEAAANREAALRLQEVIARRWGNYRPAIKADVDVTESQIQDKNLLLIGRPETNSLAARLQEQLPIKFGLRSFEVKGTTYAAAQSAVAVSGPHPHHAQRCMVLLAGLSAEATWKLPQQLGWTPCDALVVTPEGAKAMVLRKVGLE